MKVFNAELQNTIVVANALELAIASVKEVYGKTAKEGTGTIGVNQLEDIVTARVIAKLKLTGVAL